MPTTIRRTLTIDLTTSDDLSAREMERQLSDALEILNEVEYWSGAAGHVAWRLRRQRKESHAPQR